MTDIVQRLSDCPDINHARLSPIGERETEYVVPASVKFAVIAEITRLTEALRAAEEREKQFVDALIWCSGSADFNEGGQARKGWLKLCRPLIDAALAGAKP